MYRMDSGINVGRHAPDFRLVDGEGGTARLSDFAGRQNVLLVFYRGEADPFSLKWLTMIKDEYVGIRALDTEVLAISTDHMKRAYDTGALYALPFRLLCDPTAVVVQAYNVFDDMTETSTSAAFIVDRNGVIRYKYVSGAPPDLPPVIEIIKVLQRME